MREWLHSLRWPMMGSMALRKGWSFARSYSRSLARYGALWSGQPRMRGLFLLVRWPSSRALRRREALSLNIIRINIRENVWSLMLSKPNGFRILGSRRDVHFSRRDVHFSRRDVHFGRPYLRFLTALDALSAAPFRASLAFLSCVAYRSW